jgi:long-subunit acyl-CoA synthetase (AMP-forming)
LAEKAGFTIYTFDEIEQTGKNQHDRTIVEPKHDDTYMLSYTSGTTGGDPKGVKLTHKMAMAAAFAI